MGPLYTKIVKIKISSIFYCIFAIQYYENEKNSNRIIIKYNFNILYSSDDNNQNPNPYLVIPPVSLSLNLNLPEYTDLKFPGNSLL